MNKCQTLEEVESFMLKHGENLVDTLGSEVDRIEKNLKVTGSFIKWPNYLQFYSAKLSYYTSVVGLHIYYSNFGPNMYW